MTVIRHFIMLSLCFVIAGPVNMAAAGDSHHHHHAVHHGELMLKQIRIKTLMPGSKVSAGYLEIMNHGDSDDRLIGVSLIGANKAEIHTMIMDNGVMKMRPLKDGLDIPAGGHVALAPGGYHLMFMKLEDFPAKGEMAQLTLEFEKAGRITIDAPVMSIKAGHSH